jgi:hypothetical protein
MEEGSYVRGGGRKGRKGWWRRYGEEKIGRWKVGRDGGEDIRKVKKNREDREENIGK